jgi:hypothetical protein
MTENHTDGIVIQNGKMMALYKVLLPENGNVFISIISKEGQSMQNTGKRTAENNIDK